MLASWEIKRHDDPGLRWVCARCHLIGAEHRDVWMVCAGSWIDVSWEARLRRDRLMAHILSSLWFGPG